jgi:hypothetical protein
VRNDAQPPLVCYLAQAEEYNQDEARGASISSSRFQRVAKFIKKIYFLHSTNFKLLIKIKGN